MDRISDPAPVLFVQNKAGRPLNAKPVVKLISHQRKFLGVLSQEMSRIKPVTSKTIAVPTQTANHLTRFSWSDNFRLPQPFELSCVPVIKYIFIPLFQCPVQHSAHTVASHTTAATPRRHHRKPRLLRHRLPLPMVVFGKHARTIPSPQALYDFCMTF